MRSARLPLTVMPIGRVCGTGMGMELIHVVDDTWSVVDEPEHGRAEPLPLEVGLVAGEHQELLADLVAREVEAEARRPVVGEVIALEEDDRPPGAVVEQLVGVEGRDDRGVERGRAGTRSSARPREPASANPVRPATSGSPGGTWTSGLSS